MAAEFNPYHVWLGIPPDEQPANYYRLLGVRLFEADGDVIDSAADRQMAHLRTFQSGKHGDLTQRLLNEVAAARVCLLDPKKRAAYDQPLRAKAHAASGSAIRRMPVRQTPATNMPVAQALPQAVPQAVPQAAEQWDELLGASSANASHGNAGKRGAKNRNVSIGIAAAAVLAAAVGIGLFLSNGSPAQGTLVFDWPSEDRADTRLTVDNAAVAAPVNGPWEYHCPPGEHHIVAEHLAFKLDATVSVAAGEQKTVAGDWTPEAALVLSWPVALRAGAELKIDGRLYPITHREPMEIAVEPGLHVIQITRGGSRVFEASRMVAADGRQLVAISPPPAPAKLVFDWPADQRADAELTIDGRSVAAGGGPIEVALAPGQHAVQILRAGFEPFHQSVDLAAGAHQSIVPKLTPIQVTAPVVEASTSTETVHAVKKVPPPSAADQERIAKQMDDLYKTSRPSARTAALAQQLYDVAAKDGSSAAERYVLLTKGAEIAAASGDMNLSLAGIDTLNTGFEINALEMKQKLLEKFIAAGKGDHVAPAIQATEQLADQAVAADDYELALVLLSTASHAVGKSKIPDHKAAEERLSRRRHDIHLLQPIYEQVAKAQETLEKNPADLEANLQLGRWRAFYKQDWATGLPLLAKGSDAKLKSLAQAEQHGPTDADQQLQLADAWWDVAQKEAGVARDSLHLHAGEIYEAALPNMTSALRKAAIEKRIAEIASIKPMVASSEPPVAREHKTERVGGGGGGEFADRAPKGGFLVGLRIVTGQWLNQVQPIYRTRKGTVPGENFGRNGGPENNAIAKEGYAVGAIDVKSGADVDGFKLIFMRIRGQKLNPNDSYESDWLGGRGGGNETTLSGDGQRIVGIFGRCGDWINALGLVVEGAPANR